MTYFVECFHCVTRSYLNDPVVSTVSLANGVKPCLVGEELSDRNKLLSVLREFQPIFSEQRLVVDPAARMGHGHDQT